MKNAIKMKSSINKIATIIFVTLISLQGRIIAQDASRFSDEVNKLTCKEYQFDNDKAVLLFAGSSSIRKWDNIETYFPSYNVIKNGFGGSQFSDLIYYYDKLIANYKSDVILIYEGDNDIADGKKPSRVIKDAKHLLSLIRETYPETPVVFISVKPSIRRWNLKKKYTTFNNKLNKLCLKNKNTYFVDVWDIMLDKDNNPCKELFLEDNLHMNPEGYKLWTSELTNVLNNVI